MNTEALWEAIMDRIPGPASHREWLHLSKDEKEAWRARAKLDLNSAGSISAVYQVQAVDIAERVLAGQNGCSAK
jgi:hypothetical protein